MNKTIGILVVAVVILGAVALYFTNQGATPVSDLPPTPRGDMPVVEQEGADATVSDTEAGDAPINGFAKLSANAIYVPEQQLTSTVVVSHVNIVPEGYVVIRTVRDGAPGEVLGATSLEAGSQLKNTKVSLSRKMTDGEELVAMLYADNGDAVFDISKDTPVVDGANNPLSMTFYAMVDAADPASIEVMF